MNKTSALRLAWLFLIVLLLVCAVPFVYRQLRGSSAMVYVCVVRTDGPIDASAISGVQVEVDGARASEPAEGSSVLPLVLGLGRHAIAVSAPGYGSKVVAVTVSSDREMYVYVDMDRVRSQERPQRK